MDHAVPHYIDIMPQTITPTEGSTVEVNCSVSGNPMPDVTKWPDWRSISYQINCPIEVVRRGKRYILMCA